MQADTYGRAGAAAADGRDRVMAKKAPAKTPAKTPAKRKAAPKKSIGDKVTPAEAMRRATEAAIARREELIQLAADRAEAVVSEIIEDQDQAARDRISAAKLILQRAGRLTEKRQVEHSGGARVVIVPGTLSPSEWEAESRRMLGGQ